MAYDEELTARFRKALGKRDGLTDRRMMGGICFMLHGNMVGGADRDKNGIGRFMFRVGKDNYTEALSRKGASKMELGGRQMRGFIFVDEKVCDDKLLKDWVKYTVKFVKTLPPK